MPTFCALEDAPQNANFHVDFGSNTLTYDGENRVTNAANGSASGTYTYDGNGLRIKKVSGSTTTVYIFSGSKVIAEHVNGAAPASPTREYIYSGTTLLAKIESGATNYYHQDHLSNRLVTNSSGTTVNQIGHFPFGESWYNATNDKLTFTSYERDSESGNDYAMGRYYISRLARFASPDRQSGNISNPQSLNRYVYVLNNPGNLVDPSGMDPCGDTMFETRHNRKRRSFEIARRGGPSDSPFFADPFDPQFPEDGCIDSGGGGTSDVPLDPNGGSDSASSGSGDLCGGNPNCVVVTPDDGPADITIQVTADGPPDDLFQIQVPEISDLFNSPNRKPPLPIYCQPEVIQRMIEAFNAMVNGTRGNEAGFAVNGNLQNPQVNPVTVGQDRGSAAIPINPAQSNPLNPTFALFHGHANGGGAYPSTPDNNVLGSSDKGDTLMADRYHFETYVFSSHGLSVYATGITPDKGQSGQMLRSGLDWTKPCK